MKCIVTIDHPKIGEPKPCCLSCAEQERNKVLFCVFADEKQREIAKNKAAIGCLGPAVKNMTQWIFFDDFGVMVRTVPLQYEDECLKNKFTNRTGSTYFATFRLQKLYTLDMNCGKINGKNVRAEWFSFDYCETAILIRGGIPKNARIDSMNFGLRWTAEIDQLSDIVSKYPDSFHITDKLRKCIVGVGGEGVGFSEKGKLSHDIAMLEDICVGGELSSIIGILRLVQIFAILNGWILPLPDSLMWIYYNMTDLGKHMDYPQFVKFIVSINLWQKNDGIKDFGWAYDKTEGYLLYNMVFRHLRPGDILFFWGPLALIYEHGVSRTNALTMLLRWEALWSDF
eukprot:208015_1